MRVTAILPSHNHSKWVKGAINSLVHQTRQPDLIIIVNNGSIDNSAEKILSKFCNPQKSIQSGSNIECYQGKIENINSLFYNIDKAIGPSAARNLGIKQGAIYQTDIYAFLDTDDEYEPTKIEESLKWFEDDSVGLVYSDYTTQNEQTGLKIREYKEAHSQMRLMQECLANSDSLIRADVFNKVGLFDSEMRCVEDWDMWLRIAQKYILIHIPKSLVLIRTGLHSSTATVPKETWQQNWAKLAAKYAK